MEGAFSFLRGVELFAGLSDAALTELCASIHERVLEPGAVLFEEGAPGDVAYIVRSGQVEIYKQVDGRETQLAVRQPGELIGEIALLEHAPRSASGRALTACRLLVIHAELFNRLLNSSPNTARAMLHTAISRMHSVEVLLQQSEKMAQLGTLTAGVAHELNNPAAAVQRGALQFNQALAEYQRSLAELLALGLPPPNLLALLALTQPAPGALAGADLLEVSDRESALEDWLERRAVPGGWQIAPIFASLGYTPAALEQALAGLPPAALGPVLRHAAHSHALAELAREVAQGAGRIAEIVRALKSYTYLDQAPVQNINIHEGLENTLVILRHKLKQGVNVRRSFDPDLPAIAAYGSELNQVWTNLIDNAIDALNGPGTITITTSQQPPWVLVDIADSGPGIPPEIVGKIFHAFFTTKPQGKGSGLGLNISYNLIRRRGGEIRVRSQPGETHFTVWLPREPAAPPAAGAETTP